MSESFPEHIEKAEHQLDLPSPERHKALLEHNKQHKVEQNPAVTTQEARKAVAETTQSDSQPNALDRLKQAENAPQEPQTSTINEELQQITQRRELQHLWRKESKSERTLSKVIHKPAVRIASEGVGRTVSRPSGLLGGGLVAFIGSLGYLYMAHHIGFTYNPTVGLLLFVGGFVFGLALEMIVYTATRSQRRNS